MSQVFFAAAVNWAMAGTEGVLCPSASRERRKACEMESGASEGCMARKVWGRIYMKLFVIHAEAPACNRLNGEMFVGKSDRMTCPRTPHPLRWIGALTQIGTHRDRIRRYSLQHCLSEGFGAGKTVVRSLGSQLRVGPRCGASNLGSALLLHLDKFENLPLKHVPLLLYQLRKAGPFNKCVDCRKQRRSVESALV